MKVAFSRQNDYLPAFNNNKELPPEEQLKVTMKVMILLDLLDLTDVLKSVGFEKGDVKDLTIEQMKALVKEGGKYIPKYCVLLNADGFNLEDVVTYSTFLPLASELLFTLLNNSSPSAADVKN